MLVQNSVYRNTYLTDGVNKDFYFSFPILEASQVLVQTSLLTNTDVTTTVDPGQYTVTGVGQTTGGHISFTTAPPAGSRIALTLNMPITQLYQYAELDSFPAKSHENALAKLTLICQQLREQISRAVLISSTSEGSTADLIARIYAARDTAALSANAADTSATASAASAVASGNSATAAQQSAVDAAANSAGLITEVQNLSARHIGSLVSVLATDTYVPSGCVPCNGAEYTRAQFPTLYDTYLVGGKLLTCTYAAFSTQLASTGNCAKFAVDTANQKFKVPMLKDGDSITQASSTAELGKSYKAGLPDISGSIEGTAVYWDADTPHVSGAFTISYTTNNAFAKTNAVAQSIKDSGILFSAKQSNAIYGNSTTVTDEQIRLRHFVVLASAQNSASVFDWSNYMAGLAGKANTDLSNVDPAKVKLLLQKVRYETGDWASSSALIPMDDTIPQITEGTQVMAATITPKRANSEITVKVTMYIAGNGSNHSMAALFKDSGPNALESCLVTTSGANYGLPVVMEKSLSLGDTSPHTFSVRMGLSSGTMYLNGNSAGRLFGGAFISSITIEEYAA